jgi:hypothetical protein
MAERYKTTVTAFCLWLQREDIQQKLADLATCGAQLTRIGAINNLPKAVKAINFQVESYIFARCHNLIRDGMEYERVSTVRDDHVRKACTLLLRLATFDPSRPLYRKRERDPAADILAPRDIPARRSRPTPTTHELLASIAELFNLNQGAPVPVPASAPIASEILPPAKQRAEGATAFPPAFSTSSRASCIAGFAFPSELDSVKLPQGGAVEQAQRRETEGAPAFPPAFPPAFSTLPLPISFSSSLTASPNGRGPPR